MRAVIILAAIILIPALAFSATIVVPDDQPTIQAGIDAAVNGDTVLVKPGTYVENIYFLGKAITVISEQGAAVTIIDGNQAGYVVACVYGEGPDSVLDGFTLTNGYAWGGGMYNAFSRPTVANCTFIKNESPMEGGGVKNHKSDPSFTNCTFAINKAYDDGGGMYNIKSNPTMTDCTFIGNVATTGNGGGMFNSESKPTVTSCLFSKNNAVGGGGITNSFNSDSMVSGCTFIENTVFGIGGGMRNSDNSNPVVTNCNFIENMAIHSGNPDYGSGGGMSNFKSSPTVNNCNFSGNFAGARGGGMDSWWDSAPKVTNCNFILNGTNGSGGGMLVDYNCKPTVSNCIFCGNTAKFGGGIYCSSSNPTIINSSFYDNWASMYGGGIHCYYQHYSIIKNTVLWNNGAYKGSQISLGSKTTLYISYSNVKGGESSVHIEPGCNLKWEQGMIDADPLFVDGAGSDFHLTFDSPCKDTGDNTAVTELTDIEGDPRIAHGTVDMGADEFYTHLYYTGDATPGGSVELKFIDLPGASPVGFWIAFNVLDTPIPGAYGDWWLLPPMVGPFSLPSIPSNGVYVLPGTIPASPPGPYTLHLQAIMGTPLNLTNLCTIDVQ